MKKPPAGGFFVARVNSQQAASAVKSVTSTIPVVFAYIGDPIELGFATSLSRPGGNMTGFSASVAQGVYPKHLELLKELIPGAARVAILSSPTNRNHRLLLEEVAAAARAIKLQLRVIEARAPEDFEQAFTLATREGAQGVVVLGDTVSLDIVRRTSIFVDRILKGAKPAELPVQQPTKFELVINLKTREGARRQGPAIAAAARRPGDRVAEASRARHRTRTLPNIVRARPARPRRCAVSFRGTAS